MNPIYRRDGIELYWGRWEEVLPQFPDESFDLVCTSPPYNMGLVPGGNGRGMYRPGANNKAGRFRNGYGQHSDALPQEEYDTWQRATLAECWRLIKPTGAIYYNHRPRIEHGKVRLPMGFDFGGIPLGQIITWDRKTGIGVNLRRYASAYEWLLLFAKQGFRLASHSASGFSDVWRLGMEYKKDDHPAPFPESLPARVLRDTNLTSILDPYCGRGTTLCAAARKGIRAVGVELELRHCLTAIRKIEEAYGADQRDVRGAGSGNRPASAVDGDKPE